VEEIIEKEQSEIVENRNYLFLKKHITLWEQLLPFVPLLYFQKCVYFANAFPG